MKFTEFNLNEKLQKGIEKAGYEECMEVQEKSLVETLQGKDVFVQSQTGTGKTAAFLVAVLQLIPEETTPKKKTLIVAPTRELAVQIEEEAKLLNRFLNRSTGCFYGGVGYAEQERLLQKGVDIIIGTPGRLLDFAQQKKINFKDIGFLVIDEADRLLDMGFWPDLKKMLRQMPPKEERQTMLFSATLSFNVRNLIWEYMNEAAVIEITPEQVTVEKIDQKLYHVGRSRKINLLLGLLKEENPNNSLIFTNTKHSAYEVAKRLEHNGYDCHFITGDLPQKKRQKVIDNTKAGKIQFLVATDVAARGLHIDDLELVINYDLPADCENYVHRIGRTARVGKTGKAISLACETYVYGLEAIESYIGMKLPVEWAEESSYIEDKSAGRYFKMEKEGARRDSRDRGRSSSTRNKPTTLPKKDHGASRRKKQDRHVKKAEVHGASSSEQRMDKPYYSGASHHGAAVPEHGSSVKKDAKKYPARNKKDVRKAKSGSLDDRLAYYKEKYGEDFKPSPELLASEKTKKSNKSFIKKITGFFSKKK
ncbi:MAG: DEAD/DEAH box helicase [bacterium]|nr:DEAD/DEAH box helicase [bacterium]